MRLHRVKRANLRKALRTDYEARLRGVTTEARAAVRGVLRGHRAAVLLHDLPHDREPEPRAGDAAGGRRAVEAVEDARRGRPGRCRGRGRGRGARRPRRSTSTVPSARAPLGRVVEQVRDRALEAARHAAHRRRLEARVEADAVRAPAASARAPSRPPRRAARARGARARFARGRAGRRGARSAPPPGSGSRRASAPARPRADPCARWSTSTFVRRLVSGVRSSCEASATSCVCARSESSSVSSIELKLAASRPSSSLPGARSARSGRASRSRAPRSRSGAGPARPPCATMSTPRSAASAIPPTEIAVEVAGETGRASRRPRRAAARSGRAMPGAYCVVRIRTCVPRRSRPRRTGSRVPVGDAARALRRERDLRVGPADDATASR